MLFRHLSNHSAELYIGIRIEISIQFADMDWDSVLDADKIF